MNRLGIFMADGCEEVEGLTVVDLVRRAGIDIRMLSVAGTPSVTGSHAITFQTDQPADETDYQELDGVILPGGLPGTNYLGESRTVNEVIRKFKEEGKLVAAICAAPSVLGNAGILKGIRATCYPGFESQLKGAEVCAQPVVCDKNIITSRGLGTAVLFALEIIRYFKGDEAAESIRNGIMCP